MRRDRRGKNDNKKVQDKITMYSIIGVAALVVILVGLLIYSKSLSDNVQNGAIDLEGMAKQNEQNLQNILNNTNSASVSTEIGKSVEHSKNEISNNTNVNTSVKNNANNTTNTDNKTNISKQNTSTTNSKNTNTKTESTNKTADSKATENKELSFEKPIDGEIVKEYAKDNLIYSNTLQEWTTHLGIDIKADKTTVVKSAETGKVKSIKNDPRYGLTVVIEHTNGFESVYSNLLTAEFITVGEEVKQGQTIATVGNTARFEIADETHLHFEIKQNGENVDPNIYLK